MFRIILAASFVVAGAFFIATNTAGAGEYSDIKTYFPPASGGGSGGAVINRHRVMDSGRTNATQPVVVGTTSPTILGGGVGRGGATMKPGPRVTRRR